MKILARGDCCSQRAISLNRELFGGAPSVYADEKQPVRFLLEKLDGNLPSQSAVLKHLDQDALNGIDRYYFESQFTSNTLDLVGADLICMDSYADMNFKSYRHRREGWSAWVDPQLILDHAAFEEEFAFEPRPSMEQVIEDTKRLIAHYRRINPGIPVLYLAQPVTWHPRFHRFAEFNKIGHVLASSIPGFFFGGIPRHKDLSPEDLDELGWTLHFDAPSYARMIRNAVKSGLELPRIVNAAYLNNAVDIIGGIPCPAVRF